MPRTGYVCISLRRELYEELKEDAERECRTVPNYIQVLLQRYRRAIKHHSKDPRKVVT